jgi:hypothetical protein
VAGGVDVDPCGDIAGHLLAAAEGTAGLLRQCVLAGEAYQQASAEDFEKVAAVKLEAVEWANGIEGREIGGDRRKRAHRAPPFTME